MEEHSSKPQVCGFGVIPGPACENQPAATRAETLHEFSSRDSTTGLVSVRPFPAFRRPDRHGAQFTGTLCQADATTTTIQSVSRESRPRRSRPSVAIDRAAIIAGIAATMNKF